MRHSLRTLPLLSFIIFVFLFSSCGNDSSNDSENTRPTLTHEDIQAEKEALKKTVNFKISPELQLYLKLMKSKWALEGLAAGVWGEPLGTHTEGLYLSIRVMPSNDGNKKPEITDEEFYDAIARDLKPFAISYDLFEGIIIFHATERENIDSDQTVFEKPFKDIADQPLCTIVNNADTLCVDDHLLNGNPRYTGCYYQGNSVGTWTFFHPNGNKEMQYTIVDGRSTNTIMWAEDGRQTFP